MLESKCSDCVYARWDYESYYGYAKRWYFDKCELGFESEDECNSYKSMDDVAAVGEMNYD